MSIEPPRSPHSNEGPAGGPGPDPLVSEEVRAGIRAALDEDIGSGDRTTLWTVDQGRTARADIVAKAEVVVSGTSVGRAVFEIYDPDLEVRVDVADGARVPPGTVIMRLEGEARSVLTAERTALNFLGRLSGIATLTRYFVDAVRGTGARILDTRKTTPGWRRLEKHAVRCGGGTNHRIGLYDMVLVKENHIAAAGGLEAAIERVRAANHEGLAMEIEVTELGEVARAVALGVDRLLLDNMAVPMLREAVALVRRSAHPRTELEASGNVTLSTVRTIAETGVDFISVGAVTHSAPSADLSLLIRGG